MDATLKALGGILLQAIPTVILLLFLYFYLSRVFFRPLAKVLDERYAAGKGALEKADALVAAAEKKTAEYEIALRQARHELFHEQEGYRRQLQQERAEAMQTARRAADERLRQARTQMQEEVLQAKAQIEASGQQLAEAITTALLRRAA